VETPTLAEGEQTKKTLARRFISLAVDAL